jgi:hypothetical protein
MFHSRGLGFGREPRSGTFNNHRGRAFRPAAFRGFGAMQRVVSNSVAFRVGLASVLSSGAVFAWTRGSEKLDSELTEGIPWVQDISQLESVEEVLYPGRMVRNHPVGKLVAKDDHLFDTMRESGQIKEFRCFYDSKEKTLYSVVQMGK